jgi:Domain of unknown function (DUF4386)
MSHRRVAQLGAGAGIAYVGLAMAGSTVLGGGEGAPPESASPNRLAAYLVAHPTGTRQWAGAFVELLALLALIVFVAYLHTTLRRRDRQGFLPEVALGAGLVTAAIKLGSFGPAFAAHYRAKELSPQLVAALLDINSVAFALSMALTGLLIAAACGSALASQALPRWLAWAGLVVAALLVGTVPTAVTTGFGPAFLLGLLWILASSVALVRRAGVDDADHRRAAPTRDGLVATT